MFGRQQKPRQFNYVPRYYNPEQEERDEKKRIRGIETEETEDKKYIPGSIIKGGRMRRMTLEEENKADSRQRTMVRAVIFLVLLILAVYFIVNFKGFEIIVQSFTGAQ